MILAHRDSDVPIKSSTFAVKEENLNYVQAAAIHERTNNTLLQVLQ